MVDSIAGFGGRGEEYASTTDATGRSLSRLLGNYRDAAARAKVNPTTGRKNIFFGFDLHAVPEMGLYTPEAAFASIVTEPKRHGLVIYNNESGGETAYASPSDALAGTNEDGTIHPGFGVLNVDTIENPEIIGYISRDGSLKISDPRRRSEFRSRGIGASDVPLRAYPNIENDLDLSY